MRVVDHRAYGQDGGTGACGDQVDEFRRQTHRSAPGGSRIGARGPGKVFTLKTRANGDHRLRHVNASGPHPPPGIRETRAGVPDRRKSVDRAARK